MPETLYLHELAVMSNDPPARLSIRCPACHHLGALDLVGHDVRGFQKTKVHTSGSGLVGEHPLLFGLRRCPRPECHAAIFVVHNGVQVVTSFPPELLDFDTTNLPAQVLSSLEQAVQCHAIGCYPAAAIMVRRTLEDVCADQGIDPKSHDNLKKRIKALSTKVVLSVDLLNGLDVLRLLGNDAAHVEAQTYNQVGKDEVELAIEVVKVLLQSLYQTSDLVVRLQALQKSAATTPTTATVTAATRP